MESYTRTHTRQVIIDNIWEFKKGWGWGVKKKKKSRGARLPPVAV